jgi:hypothetical protein
MKMHQTKNDRLMFPEGPLRRIGAGASIAARLEAVFGARWIERALDDPSAAQI